MPGTPASISCFWPSSASVSAVLPPGMANPPIREFSVRLARPKGDPRLQLGCHWVARVTSNHTHLEESAHSTQTKASKEGPSATQTRAGGDRIPGPMPPANLILVTAPMRKSKAELSGCWDSLQNLDWFVGADAFHKIANCSATATGFDMTLSLS